MLSLHTQKRKIIISLFSCLLIFQNNFAENTSKKTNQISEKAIISTYQGANGPWQFLEYHFIVKPKNELDRIMEHSFTALGIVGTSMLTKYFFLDSNDSENTDKTSPKNTPTKNNQIKNIVIILSSLAAGKTIYKMISNQINHTIQKKSLIEILENWDLYRLHIPTSLIEYFDELALQYEATGTNLLTSTLISEVFELINHHIEHHFEARYKKAEPKSINDFDTFKCCTEMWKNLE